MEFTIKNFRRSWYKFARKFLWTFHIIGFSLVKVYHILYNLHLILSVDVEVQEIY